MSFRQRVDSASFQPKQSRPEFDVGFGQFIAPVHPAHVLGHAQGEVTNVLRPETHFEPMNAASFRPQKVFKGEQTVGGQIQPHDLAEDVHEGLPHQE